MSTRTIAAGVAAASLLALLGAAPAEARSALNALSMNGLSINGLSVNGTKSQGLYLNGVGSTGVEHDAPGEPAAFNPNALRVVGVGMDATPLYRNSASPKLLLRIP